MTSPTSLDREAWPGRLTSNRERVAQAARSIEPLLNRVVFTGRQVAQLLETSALPTGARASFAADTVVRVLSTATLDRVATEVQRMGLTRGPRTAKGDRWIVNDDVILEFTYIAGDEDDPAAIWLEYASLLTMAVDVGTRDKTLVARITGAPALLALDWATVSARNESPLDSGELEDIIALVAGRAEVVREIAASPADLRSFVAAETRRFLAYPGAEHVIRNAIQGAAMVPALVARAADRLRTIALLAAVPPGNMGASTIVP